MATRNNYTESIEFHYTCEAFFEDCLRNNRLDELKFAHEHFGIIDREWHICGSACFGIRGCRAKGENLLDAAFWYNNTEMADWLFKIGMTPNLSHENDYTCEAFFEDCLKNNKLDELKFAHERFGIIDREWHACGSACTGEKGCAVQGENLLDFAIRCKKTEIANWLREIGMTPNMT